MIHIYIFRKYSKATPNNVLADVRTERPCVAYATFHSRSIDTNYRYRMKDVDCQLKAPFICQYNPGYYFNFSYLHQVDKNFKIQLIQFCCTICFRMKLKTISYHSKCYKNTILFEKAICDYRIYSRISRSTYKSN
jgi:hypothetical protein